MPPASKKDCGLVLFDIASRNKFELLNGLIKFSTFKWFMNSKSIYRLVLINTAKSDNDKNYPHIYTTDVDDFDPKLVIDAIENEETGKANWLDALLLGISYLEEAVDLPGLITLQLIYFTALDTVYSPVIDATKVKTIIDKLNENNIFLYIVGPDVELPYVITSPNSIKNCMKDLEVPKQDPGHINLVAAKKIISAVNNAVMCNCKIGVNLLISFKNSQGSLPWKKPFTFGTKLMISSVTTKLYRKDISLKLYSPTPKTVTKVLADDTSVKVEPSDIVKGLIRHGQFLKIDDQSFKGITERCFEIIGFTDKKNVPETYLRGEDTFYVLPSEFTNDGFQVFTHLVKILAETNKYAFGKRVYFNKNKPHYFVLIPCVEHDPKCFIMTGLPYANNLTPHKYETPSSPKEAIKQDAFYRFFKSMIIDTKGCKAGASLGPTMMIDFSQHRVIDVVAKKYLRKPFLDLESLIINDIDNQANNEFLETLKRSWPVKGVEK